MNSQQYLLIGEIIKPQGLKGEVKVKPYTDDISRFLDLPAVYTQEDRAVNVLGARVQGDMVCLRLEGVPDRTAAEAWRGIKLYVQRQDAVPLAPDQWFIADLVGCRVEDDGGEVIGILQEVLQTGANDVYVLKDGERQILIPAVKVLLKRVDTAAGCIVVSRERFHEMAVFI